MVVTLPNSESRPSKIKKFFFSNKSLSRPLISKDTLKYLSFGNLCDAEKWLNIYRWKQVRRGYTLPELEKIGERNGLEIQKVAYYLSGKVLELWDLATFSKLNDVFPINFFLLFPFMHILNLFEKGRSDNSAVIAASYIRKN